MAGHRGVFQSVLAILAACIVALASQSAKRSALPAPKALPTLSAQEIFKRVSPSVMVVESLDANGKVAAFGSGVMIAPGQVITNRHVIEDGVSFRIEHDGKQWPAKLVRVDPDHDLAELSVAGLHAPPVTVRDSSKLAVGETVYAVGAPEGLELTISEGLISGLRDFDKGRVIQTSAAISPGSSGGGLFDAEGRLVGITTFYLKEGQSLNFALPAERTLALEEPPRDRGVPLRSAGAEDLCSFITHKMQLALPQVPTLCTPVAPYVLPGGSVVSVFSPTDVLEGKMRRAWSTALFRTAQGLFFGGMFNGACESAPAPTCELLVSDSSLSRSGMYYRLDTPVSLAERILAGDPASEGVYDLWWQLLEAGKTSEDPERMSKGGAEAGAQVACREFRKAFPEALASVFPAPACSAILATDNSVYIVLDFPNILDAALVNNAWPMLDAFGKAFDETGYEGEVIFKTPWSGSGARLYRMYSLREIEFWWEEAHAGVTDKADAALNLHESAEEGQEDKDNFPATVRYSAVVSVTSVPSSRLVLVDLTDGSEWSFPADTEPGCDLVPGAMVLEAKPMEPNASPRATYRTCNSIGTFVQGW
jgi:Trypsin-like peptidase domain